MSRPGYRVAVVLAVAAMFAGVGAAAAAVRWQRLRHLAVPTLEDPSLPPAASILPIEDGPARALSEVARLPGRVAALLETDQALWAGGFDTGVFRLERREGGYLPVAVLGVSGRERFVNALAEREGRVFAATYAGVLEIDGSGKLVRRHLMGIATESLLATGDTLLAGTVDGVFALRDRGFARVALAAHDGSSIRVTAMAAAGRKLLLGSPNGVHSVALEGLQADGVVHADWHPLVFGEQAARTNVVLALAPWGEGVLAGTDDGGVVLVDEEGTRAFELDERHANEVNPGAVAVWADRVLVGTQGGGLLAVGSSAGRLVASRPGDWKLGRVSAISAGAELLVGGEDGGVFRVGPPVADGVGRR
ncbi:MAG: hypothetical protein ACOX6T_02305 [Myxococcales bacterium]|jgi:hypothetical protein